MFALNLTNLCTWRAINLLGEKPKFYAKIRKFLRKKNFFGEDGNEWGEIGLDEDGEKERGWMGTGGWGEVGMGFNGE